MYSLFNFCSPCRHVFCQRDSASVEWDSSDRSKQKQNDYRTGAALALTVLMVKRSAADVNRPKMHEVPYS